MQLAKAAIRTGIELLMRDRALAEADIELVVIAGAFGAYINVGSAVAIGLLPELPLDRFKQVGNAAGVGVRQILASRKGVRARENSPSAAVMSSSARATISRRHFCITSASNHGERCDQFARFRYRHDRRPDQSRFQEHKATAGQRGHGRRSGARRPPGRRPAQAPSTSHWAAWIDHFEYLGNSGARHPRCGAIALCFDSPSAQVQEVCFKAYDRARANGGPALVNSVTEQRWDIMDLYKPLGPFKVIVMASERMEDGAQSRISPPTKLPRPPGAPPCA